MDFVNQVTFDCLANRQRESKRCVQQSIEEERRCLALFHALLGGIRVRYLPTGVEYAFHNFMAAATEYFQELDEMDEQDESTRRAIEAAEEEDFHELTRWRREHSVESASDADIKLVKIMPGPSSSCQGRESSNKDWQEKYVGIEYAEDTLDEETQED